LLDRYGFTNVDDFDLVLLDAVRNGYVDTEQLEVQAEALDARHKAEHSDKELNDAWALVHDSFDDNEDEVVEKLGEAYAKNIQIVTPSNLESLVGLMKAIGRDDAAKEGVAFYMEERGNEEHAFYDLENHPFATRFSDPDLANAFKDKLATFKTEIAPVAILERIDQHKSWSPPDIAALCALSVADYKKMFKTERGARMRSIVRAALGFERIVNRGTDFDPIINNARKALEEIALESKLNARRVARLIGPPPAIPENAELVDEVEYDEEK
jgi:5'-3' exonuclease